jgi:hypothetical protein
MLGCLWNPNTSHQNISITGKYLVFCVCYSALLSKIKSTIRWVARLASTTIERAGYAYEDIKG